MTVPDFQSLMLPLLNLAKDGADHTLSDAIEQLAREFQLSEVDRKELIPSGGQSRFNNRGGVGVDISEKGWSVAGRQAGSLSDYGHRSRRSQV
jgi:restriction system protein